MTKGIIFRLASLMVIFLLVLPHITAVSVESGMASSRSAAGLLSSFVDVPKCNYSIHIMAMLSVGFGFWFFIKKYGFSEVMTNYFLNRISIPMYLSYSPQ